MSRIADTEPLMDRYSRSFISVAPHSMRGLAFVRSAARREVPHKLSQTPCQARGDERGLGLVALAA